MIVHGDRSPIRVVPGIRTNDQTKVYRKLRIQVRARPEWGLAVGVFESSPRRFAAPHSAMRSILCSVQSTAGLTSARHAPRPLSRRARSYRRSAARADRRLGRRGRGRRIRGRSAVERARPRLPPAVARPQAPFVERRARPAAHDVHNGHVPPEGAQMRRRFTSGYSTRRTPLRATATGHTSHPKMALLFSRAAAAPDAPRELIVVVSTGNLSALPTSRKTKSAKA